ncbi:MAG: thioredoxin domain-containing protein [Propionibacteriaceae bacterium]|nr:thioredoxin domain-containing protein [Propionibacteriaceae bacterium]
MVNNAGPSRREAMRLKAEAEEARGRRNARILWISLAAVAVAVVVILALVISSSLAKNGPSAEQQTPPNATEKFGIGMPTQDVEPAADAAHLIIWEDSQCPICSEYEKLYGPVVKQLVDEGKITAEIRTAHFLDAQLRNDSSERAALAGAAADAVGKFREFHDVLFANQPEEGVGFTDQQLRVDFPTQAGIEGDDLTKFQELYDGRAFADFVKKANDQFTLDGITGTPTYLVGDTKLEFFSGQEMSIQPTPEDLLRAINEANA